MNTYSKLRDDSWGIRCTTEVKPGDVVLVEKRDGTKKNEVVKTIVWQGQGVWLCSVEPKAKSATETTPAMAQTSLPRTSGRPAGWRPCGYPGCNPNYCDECDGMGAGRGRRADW
jgi:hypothetical protein